MTTDVIFALRDTLKEHLDEYMSRSALRGLQFFLDPREVHATDCPAITIFDMGSQTRWETIRGRDAGGELYDGYVMERFRVNVIVWAKAAKLEELTLILNNWRDGIKACLRDNWDLGGKAVNVVVESDDPTVVVPEESAALQAVQIRLNVDAYHEQSSVTL